MSSVADAPLAALYRDASPETAAAFVADLYAAQGWAVDRSGGRRLVVSADGTERRVGVVHPADTVPAVDLVAWADAVVALDGSGLPDGVEVVDAAALGRRLAYAIDRPVARRLLETHFGWAPRPDDGRAGGRPGVVGRAVDSVASRVLRSPGGRSRVVLVAVLVVVVTGGIAVVMAEQLEPEVPGEADAATATPASNTPEPVVEESPTPATETSMTERPDRQFSNLPPAIEQSGDIRGQRLTARHDSILENESYRLTVTYRESVDGRPTGVYTETVRVENATRYSASVSRHGTLQAPAPSIVETDVYANGSVRFEHTNGTVQRGVVISYDRFLAGHVRLLTVFLEVRSSSILDYQVDNGSGSVYLVTEGNPATVIRNTTGTVTVRADGLVTRGRWSYQFSRQLTEYGNVTATYSLRLSDVGTTTLRKPDWVPPDATGNVTATNESTATATNATG